MLVFVQDLEEYETRILELKNDWEKTIQDAQKTLMQRIKVDIYINVKEYTKHLNVIDVKAKETFKYAYLKAIKLKNKNFYNHILSEIEI